MLITDIPIWLALIIIAFAAYRLTRFFVEDSLLDGPRWWLKNRAYVFDQETEEPVDYNPVFRSVTVEEDGEQFEVEQENLFLTELRGKAADLLTCSFCLGFWITGLTILAWVNAPDFVLWIILWFAVAGAQALISSRPGA